MHYIRLRGYTSRSAASKARRPMGKCSKITSRPKCKKCDKLQFTVSPPPPPEYAIRVTCAKCGTVQMIEATDGN